MSIRMLAVAVGLSICLMAGCDKSGSTGTGSGTGVGTSSPPPSKGGDSSYAKKLVGVWEGTEEFDKGKVETVTLEFKGDGGLSMVMGPFKLTGTYKVTKEDGKTLMMDTEMTIEGFDDPKGKAKPDKKEMKVVFTDDNTIVMSKTEGKAEEKTFKRKK